MMWHVNGMTGWQFPFMIVYPLLFTGLLALGVIWLVRALGPQPNRMDDSRRILAERYARGELTDDEYRARLTTLRQS